MQIHLLYGSELQIDAGVNFYSKILTLLLRLIYR